jgi:hypothetical protein
MCGGGVVGVRLSRSQVFLILDKLMEDHGDDVRAWLALNDHEIPDDLREVATEVVE